MVDMFVRDIVKGIGDTGIKAGVIKCATDIPGVTKDVERVLRACAQAHRKTGVPLTTHTNAATRRGLEQQRIFKEEGVDLERVVIGHCGDTDELDYLLEVMSYGSILGMDRFGLDGYLTTEKRVATVAELCKRGHADQMVLSHDCSCFLDWIPGELPLAHVTQLELPAHLEGCAADAAGGWRHRGPNRRDAHPDAEALPDPHRPLLTGRQQAHDGVTQAQMSHPPVNSRDFPTPSC